MIKPDARTLEPNTAQMLAHLEHLFGGYLDGAQDGLVEICWRDARSGALSRAQLFKTDELEEAAAKAAEVNRIPGQNVYVGYALRKPDTCPFARASDDDFLCPASGTVPRFCHCIHCAGSEPDG